MGGLAGHIDAVGAFYRKQCEAFVESAERHLKGVCVRLCRHALRAFELVTVRHVFCLRAHCIWNTPGLVEYKPPSAGMFVWMNLLGVDDSFKLVTDLARSSKVRACMVPWLSLYSQGVCR